MSQYTSESEFNLEKRVHITNEIPPYDMFDALNSVMQTTVKNGEVVPSIWQWILGYTKVEYDLPYLVEEYNSETDSIEYKRDIDNEAVYYKMVNGKLADEYGPVPKDFKESIETKYHRLEEYGVLLPEFDFLLHEGYRYLGTIYPDHPDYTKLLTDNEFNDFISQAASIIDYEPNNLFFDKLVSSLGLEKEEALREAAMCKIRNLRNEAYRRKLYGSKFGYRMLANELLYTVTVFPVATYLPLRQIDKNTAKEQLEVSLDFDKLNQWNIENSQNLSSEGYIKYIRQHNRKIDTFSKNYYKKLRLIDYDGSSSKYKRPDKNIRLFGLVVPFNEYTVCEYPAVSDIETKISKVRNGLQCDIEGEVSFVTEVNLNLPCYSYTFEDGKIKEESFIDVENHSFNVTSQQKATYTDLYIYPSFEDTLSLDNIKDIAIASSVEILYSNPIMQEIYSSTYFQDLDFLGKVSATANPTYCDTILLSPSNTLNLYPDMPTYTKDVGYSSGIEWESSPIKEGNVVTTDKVRLDKTMVVNEAAEVVGFTKGKISFIPTENERIRTLTNDNHTQFIKEDERYGIVIKTNKGKKVVLFGGIDILEEIENSLFAVNRVNFSIGAIPEVKNENLLSVIYGEEYTNLLSDMASLEETLIKGETSYSFERENARKYLAGDKEVISLFENSGLPYEEYISAAKEKFDLEAKLEDMTANRSHIYHVEDDIEYSDINNKCEVVQILLVSGNVQGAYYEYTTLPLGFINSISFGDINVVSIISDGVVINSDDIQIQKVGQNYFPAVKEFYKQRVQEGNLSSQLYSNTTRKFKDSVVNYVPSNTACFDYDRETVQIESVIDSSVEGKENLISFESDMAKELSKTLSVGDIVTGPTIDSDDEDVFITSVGDGYVTVSTNLIQSGTFVLNYLVKTNITINDITDDIDLYQQELYDNGLYEEFNPFKQGLYPSPQWPNVSKAILDSLVDISLFDLHNVQGTFKTDENGEYELDSNGEKIKVTKDTFTIIMEEVYADLYKNSKKNDVTKLLMPSDIKFNNELFVEFNLNKLLNYPSIQGINPILMSVDWLDYVNNSLEYSSKATDKVNVGTNLMMETDTSGYYTLISGQKYTDPNTRVKFITMNINGLHQWPEVGDSSDELTIPVYAQIGTGGAGRNRWFKNIDDITYPNIWGVSVYDDYKYPKDIKDKKGNITHYGYDDNSKFYKEGGELRRVTVYGQTFENNQEDINSDYFRNIENPIMEVPLGEYDTVTRYSNKETGSGLLTITNVSFYKQAFQGLLKYFDNTGTDLSDDCRIQILGSDMSGVSLLEPLNYKADSWYLEDSNDRPTAGAVGLSNSNISFLRGITISKDEEGNISLPKVTGNRICTITETSVLNEISPCVDEDNQPLTDKTSLTFEKGDILIKYDESWFLKKFQFCGLLGDGLDFMTPAGTKGYVTSNTNFPPISSKTTSEVTKDNLAEYLGVLEGDVPESFEIPEEGINLFERLLQYLIRVDTDIPTANLLSLNYYSYLSNNGVDPTEVRAGDASTTVNNLNDVFLLRDITTVDGKTIEKPLMTLTENTNTHLMTSDGESLYTGYIPFFTYVGGEKYRNYFEKYSIKIDVGDSICLLNVGRCDDATGTEKPYKWQLYKLNRNCMMGLSIPMKKYGNIPDTEFAAAIGDTILAYKTTDENGKQWPVYIDTSNVSITNKIDAANSNFTLPRRFITEGSYDFKFTVDPKFIGEGYSYNDDGTINYDKPCTFEITHGSIYYDQDNDAFYMYSRKNGVDANNFNQNVDSSDFGDKLEKFAIKFNEQKYFKNILNTVCVYQLKESLDSDNSRITTIPTLSALEDISFDVEKIDVGDRLLKVEKIDLRSIYNKALEPVLFSNYLDIDYTIKGITEDGKLYASYIGQPENTAERVNFAISVDNFLPTIFSFDDEGGSYKVTNYPKNNIDFINDNTIIYDPPTLKNVKITKSLTQDSFSKPAVSREFIYYKNTLPFKATIDLSTPNTLIAPNDDKDFFDKAIVELGVGDSLISAYALTDSPIENKLKVEISYNGNVIEESNKIVCIKFVKDMFMAITKDGIAYYNYNCNIGSIGDTIDCSRAILSTNRNNDSLTESQEVFSLDFDYDNDTWLVEVKEGTDIKSVTSAIYGFTTEETPSEVSGILYMTPMFTDEAGIITYTITNEEGSDPIRTPLAAYGSDFNSNTDEKIEIGSDKVDVVKDIEQFVDFQNSVISGIAGETYTTNIEDVRQVEAELNLVFTKDVAIRRGTLKLNTEESLTATDTTKKYDFYEVEEPLSCGPYLTDTMELNFVGSRLKISDTINSRALVASDVIGNYQLYVKGRDFFIKSPTALVEKLENPDGTFEYGYNGRSTGESYWKYAKAPIFSNREESIYRSMDVEKLSSFAEDIGTAMKEYLDSLSTSSSGILVNGEKINSDATQAITNIKNWLGVYTNTATFDKFKEIIGQTVAKVEGQNLNTTSLNTSYGFRITYTHTSTNWSIKLYFPKIGFVERNIPDKLYTAGVCKKKMAMIKDGLTYEVDVPLKPDYTDFNYEAAYGDYVYILSKIFGYTLDDDLNMSSNINKAQFTDNNLFMLDEQGFLYRIGLEKLTKRDDIENLNNWTVGSYPENFIYRYVDDTIKTNFNFIYADKDSENVISVPQTIYKRLNSTFKTVCSYIREDLIILGGYTLSRDKIKSDYEKAVGEEHVNQAYLDSLFENSEYENLTTPTVLYSNDGGNSFRKANLPSLGDTVSLSYYITSIRFLNNKYYFYCSTPGEEVFNNSGYILNIDENGLYDFENSIEIKTLTDEDKEYGISEQFDIDSSVGMRGRTALSASVANNNLTTSTAPSAKYRLFVTKNASYFHLASSQAITTKDIVVTDKGQDFVSLSGGLLPIGDGKVDLLLSFKTEADITDQYKYLNTDNINKYINDWGDLKVAEVVEVDGKQYANRFYSYRELLTEEEKRNEPFGYPAYSEDNDKLYYTYTDIELNEDEIPEPAEGEELITTITKVDYMTNQFDSEIKLCDASGNYMFIGHNYNTASNFATRVKSENSFEIYDSAYNTKYGSLAEAEKDPAARKEDSVMMSLIGIQKVKVDYFNADREFPRVIINLNNTANTITRLRDLLFTDDKEFAEYLNSTAAEGVSENTISTVTYNDGEGDKIKYSKVNYNGTEYWYNNQEGFFPIRNKRFISSKVYMPYTHGGEIVRFTNTSLDNIYKEDSEIGLPITGIFLSKYGYGGTRNNTDMWKYELPWQKDPAAFEKEFVKNINGDHIYLTDAIGNEITSYNSEMFIENGDRTGVSREVFGNKFKKDVILSGNNNDEEHTPWEVHTEFTVCEFVEPQVFAAYDLDSTGEQSPIIIYNGDEITEPLTFTEPFFVYKNGKNLYNELDSLDEANRKFNVEFHMCKTMANTVYTAYVDANDWIAINENTLSFVNRIDKFSGSAINGSLFNFESNGTIFKGGEILGFRVSYSYRGVMYEKEFLLSWTPSLNDLMPSPSIEFRNATYPIVVRKYDFTEEKANLEDGIDVTGKYVYTGFNFNTMQDDNSKVLDVVIKPIGWEHDDLANEGNYMGSKDLVCNNPNAYSISGPLIFNQGGERAHGKEGLVDTISFLITKKSISAYETRLLNFNIDTFNFEVGIPVVDLGKITTVYYNDWDIKKRAVGQEEARTREFAVFIGDERLDDKYGFELTPSHIDSTDPYFDNLVECKMVNTNFIFDKKVLEENTDTANNRDEFRIRSWQAYNTITVSNCGNDSSMDYHIIKFPIGLFDTYIGKFIGNGVPGFEGWSVKYNDVDVTSSFLYTFENNLPYLTSQPHAFDKDGDIFKYNKDTGNTLVLKVNYDYYEDTMSINVEWDDFFSSPRLVSVSPFVLKNIPNEKNGFSEVGPYLMSEEITYNTTITENGILNDYDAALNSTVNPLTFELQQTILPDYNESQLLLDGFSAIINGEFDTYNELNAKIKNITFNYDSLADTWNGVMEDFGTVAKLILGPMNDEEEDTKFINDFKTNLDNKTISSAVEGVSKLNDTIDKYTVLNLYDLLGSLKEELSQLHDEVDTHFAEEWMSSNYKDIPTAVDNVYKFVNSELDIGFKYNDFEDFTRYPVDSKLNLATFMDVLDDWYNRFVWVKAPDETGSLNGYGVSIENNGKVYTEDTISSIINNSFRVPLAEDKIYLTINGDIMKSHVIYGTPILNSLSILNLPGTYKSTIIRQANSLHNYIRLLISDFIESANTNRINGRFIEVLDIPIDYRLVDALKFTHDNNLPFPNAKSIKAAFDNTYYNILSHSVWDTYKDRKIVSKDVRTKTHWNWFSQKAIEVDNSLNDLINYYNYRNVTEQDSFDQIKTDFFNVQIVPRPYHDWAEALSALETALSTYRDKVNVSYTEKAADMSVADYTIILKDICNNDSNKTIYRNPIVGSKKTFKETSTNIVARIQECNNRLAEANEELTKLESIRDKNSQDLSNFNNTYAGWKDIKSKTLDPLSKELCSSKEVSMHENEKWATTTAIDNTIKGDFNSGSLSFANYYYDKQGVFNNFVDSRQAMKSEAAKYSSKTAVEVKNYRSGYWDLHSVIAKIDDSRFYEQRAPRFDISNYNSTLNSYKGTINSAFKYFNTFDASVDSKNYDAGTWSGTYKGNNVTDCLDYRIETYNNIVTGVSIIQGAMREVKNIVDLLSNQILNEHVAYERAKIFLENASDRLTYLLDSANSLNSVDSTIYKSRPSSFDYSTGRYSTESYYAVSKPRVDDNIAITLYSTSLPSYDLGDYYGDLPTKRPFLWFYTYISFNDLYARRDWYTYNFGKDSLQTYNNGWYSAAQYTISVIDKIVSSGLEAFVNSSVANSLVTKVNNNLATIQSSINNYYISGFNPVSIVNTVYTGRGTLYNLYKSMVNDNDAAFKNEINRITTSFNNSWDNIVNHSQDYIRKIAVGLSKPEILYNDSNSLDFTDGESFTNVSLSNVRNVTDYAQQLYISAWKVYNEKRNIDLYYNDISNKIINPINIWTTQQSNINEDMNHWNQTNASLQETLNSIYSLESILNCRTSLLSSDFNLISKSDFNVKSTLNRTLLRYQNLITVYNTCLTSPDLVPDSKVIYYRENSVRPSSIPNLHTYISTFVDSKNIEEVRSMYDSIILSYRNKNYYNSNKISDIKVGITTARDAYRLMFDWAATAEEAAYVRVKSTYDSALKHNIERGQFIEYLQQMTYTEFPELSNRFIKGVLEYLHDTLLSTNYIFDKVPVVDIKNSIKRYTDKVKVLYSEIYKLIWHSDDVNYDGINGNWVTSTNLESSFGYFFRILQAVKQYYDVGIAFVNLKEDKKFEFNIKDVMSFQIKGAVIASHEKCKAMKENDDPNVRWQGYIGDIFTSYLYRLYKQNYAIALDQADYPLDSNMNTDYIRDMYVLNNDGGEENSQVISLPYNARFAVHNDSDYIDFDDISQFNATSNLNVTDQTLRRVASYSLTKDGTYVISQFVSSLDTTANPLSKELTRCGAKNNIITIETGKTYTPETDINEDAAYISMPTSITSRLKLPLFIYDKSAPVDDRILRPIKTIVGKFKWYLDTDGEPFVLYNGVDKVEFNVIRLDINLDEYTYISGVEGPVMLRKPKYNSFYNLIQSEGYVIVGDTLVSTAPLREEKVSKDNPLDTTKSLVNFGLKNDKNTAIQLVNRITSSKEDLNDGEKHYIRIKVLTQSTILAESTTCNEPDNFEEINLNDFNKFTPDRVWFNELGYPLPPLQIGNDIFNSENNYAFTKEDFKNNNGFSIYRCNVDGKIIGFSKVESKKIGLIKEENCDGGVIRKSTGVISKGATSFVLDGTIDLENAQVPNKPKYVSCKEWFKNGFYVQDHESNPFWQVLRISSTYNSSKEGWKQYYQVLEYQRSTNNMSLVPVEKDDRYINVDSTVVYKKSGNTSGNIDIMYSDEYVDLKNGKINFTMLRPADKYRTSDIIIKYGITAKNTFSIGVNNLLEKSPNVIWDGGGYRVAAFAELNYTVNSTMALENKIDKSADIVDVTELGLFNKDHELIAYATFPPIEFHTDTQHASFTCYIKNGNLAPLGEEETTEETESNMLLEDNSEDTESQED